MAKRARTNSTAAIPMSRKRKGKRMASSPDPKTNGAGDDTVREGANVDKIRDILFGSQMRDYDKRFVRLEERLTRDAEAHREELKKRFDSLEAFVRQEAESLGQRLKAEKSERLEILKELTREVRESDKALEKKLSQLDDAMAKGTTEIRARILEQSKSLSAEIGEKHRELSSVLDREVQALRADKTDREALADLFTELALRLKKEFALPEAK
jgi:vacuolar-type H+-ATPase subunit I/STV1